MPRPEARQPDRRAFLGTLAWRAAAAVAAPSILGGCRRRSKAESDSAAGQSLRNLDDVPDAATFRPSLPQTEPLIRVRVLRVREAARDKAAGTLRIGDANQWIALEIRRPEAPEPPSDRRAGAEARGGDSPHRHALEAPLEISMTDSGWSVVDVDGYRASVRGHETLDVAPLDASGLGRDYAAIMPMMAGGEHRRYRGTLRLVSRHDLDAIDTGPGTAVGSGRRTASRAFDVINDIPLETYLPGVLAGELYAHWQPATFAAQAVAARSFACTEAAVFAGKRHYDVTNTASSQMYLGVVTSARAHEAVGATRGIVLAYQNLLVSGYYSSCCGGAAATATDAIGSNPVNDAAPLRGRSGTDVCTEAPVYAWEVGQPLDTLMRRLAGFARERRLKPLQGLRTLASIDVISTNTHGRAARFALTDVAGATAELTAENLRRAANWSGGSGANAVKPPERELRSSHFRATIAGNTVTFEGQGFGHGVGLCQYGAEALAKSGSSFQDILRWYYPDVEIVQAYA